MTMYEGHGGTGRLAENYNVVGSFELRVKTILWGFMTALLCEISSVTRQFRFVGEILQPNNNPITT